MRQEAWELVANRRLEEVARRLQRRASLPGFRKGRVPLEMVRQHYAEAVEQVVAPGGLVELTRSSGTMNDDWPTPTRK